MIEARIPLTIRVLGEERDLQPGHPVDLSTEQARKLLAKARGKVRVVESIANNIALSPGTWIEFKSPLFGLCTGQVDMVDEDTLVVDHHSVIKALTNIKLTWVTRTLDHPPDGDSTRSH